MPPAEVVKRRVTKVVLAPKTVRTSTSHKLLLIVTLPIVMQSDSYLVRDAVFKPKVMTLKSPREKWHWYLKTVRTST